jgi:hypothetical protein
MKEIEKGNWVRVAEDTCLNLTRGTYYEVERVENFDDQDRRIYIKGHTGFYWDTRFDDCLAHNPYERTAQPQAAREFTISVAGITLTLDAAKPLSRKLADAALDVIFKN